MCNSHMLFTPSAVYSFIIVVFNWGDLVDLKFVLTLPVRYSSKW